MAKYTGIENPCREGQYSVDQNAKVINRYRYIHERVMFVAAGHLPAREDWDVKLTLGRHIFEDAEAVHLLRERVIQLRTSSGKLNQEPDPLLTLLLEELIQARNDLELMAGIYEVIKPALLETYRRHMENTQHIVDQPTVRMLRFICSDLTEQIRVGQELVNNMREVKLYPFDDSVLFIDRMREFLRCAGGIDGLDSKNPEVPLRWRSTNPYRLPIKSVRDPRKMGPTTLARTGVEYSSDDPVVKKLVSMMRVRQEEMTAVELIAGVLYQTQNMPWEFYHDLARHIWDETRHAMFGQAALEVEGIEWMKRPQYVADYDVNASRIPGHQYSWLSIGVEAGAMIFPGKKGEYLFCRDEAKHPLMTQFQDYDWADEVLHANFGRKWAPELIGENIEFVRQLAQTEIARDREYLATIQEEWDGQQA